MGKSIIFKTLGLLYLCIVMCGAIFAGLLWKFFGYSLGVSLAAVFIVAIPLTVIILYFLLQGEKNSKFGKLHTEFIQELVKNGYSERFLAISEEAVAANRLAAIRPHTNIFLILLLSIFSACKGTKKWANYQIFYVFTQKTNVG